MLFSRWFEIRKSAEAFYGIPVNNNLCLKGGRKFYKPMELTIATFPTNQTNFIFDDSPDLLKPPPESRYITEDYDNVVGGHESSLRAQAEMNI